ncbi:hypothetical protein SD427_14520 [Chryseobacterium sp. JJR-5R]|uniref:hypothetical protein n=1 Tax=Chryseobacterium sp. JJR-5R TaxID=3093923 RepID=UPI002A74BEC8|nr:hypothetical protein [Chryseobacterium sp. JJR-5R]WPO81972.1 hypothetical protein SD427_14520 [Chryseobacterium sp. JJR-5R]
MANSELARAFERQPYSIDNNPIALTPMSLKNADLQFFPTAEGYYDYKKDHYIYQYKDHLDIQVKEKLLRRLRTKFSKD